MGKKLDALNERQRLFVVALVMGNLRQTAAARAAGYLDTGSGALKVRASNLVRRSDVCAAIDELAWEKFQAQYRPVHKLSHSASYNSQQQRAKDKARKGRVALKALEELGIKV